MKSSFETFINAYRRAPVNVQQLLDSETIALFVEELLTKNNLPHDFKSHFLVLISNQLLGISTSEESKTAIQNILQNPAITSKMCLLIDYFIADQLSAEKALTSNKEQSLDQVVHAADMTAGDTVSPPPRTLADQDREGVSIPVSTSNINVSTIRTMAKDMAKSQANTKENVYSSTQEAILREGWSNPK